MLTNNLPPNWSWVKLGDVTEFIYGKGLIKADRNTEGKFPVYGSNGIVGYHNEYLVEGPCLIVGRKGAAGEVHLSNTNCWPIDTTYYIKPNEKYSINYLYYVLRNLRLTRLDKSTAIPGLNRNDAYKLSIPLPPLSEQKKIVEKIEELFSGLDSGVAYLKKAKEQIRLYRQSVLSAAFSGMLTQEARGKKQAYLNGVQVTARAAEPKVEYSNQLPDGWKWVKLGDISKKIQYGYTESASQEPVGPKFLRITDIQNGNVIWKEVPYCQISEEQKSKYLLNEGDIVFARTGATVGKSFLITGKIPESIFASYLIRIQLAQDINKKYIYFFFQSFNYWQQITVGQVGIGQPNVNGTKLSKLLIPICPLEQQTQIVEEIEKRFSEADNLEKAIDESLAKSETLRQSILKQAFEGGLV